jgi:hypothetical protein
VANGYPQPIGVGWPGWPTGANPPSYEEFQQMTPGLKDSLIRDYMTIGVLDQVLQEISNKVDYLKDVSHIATALEARLKAEEEQWKREQNVSPLVPLPPPESKPEPETFQVEWNALRDMISGFPPGAPLEDQSPSLADLLNNIVRYGQNYSSTAASMPAAVGEKARKNLITELVRIFNMVNQLQTVVWPVLAKQITANTNMLKLGPLNTNRTVSTEVLNEANETLLKLQTLIPEVVGKMQADCFAKGFID